MGNASISKQTCITGTATVTGATASMVVVVSPQSPSWATANNISWDGWVSAADQVTVRLCNNSATNGINPGATTMNIRVIK